MMNALVTQADGLLGASLIRALRWEGHSVTAVVSSLHSTEWLAGDSGVRRLVASELSGSDPLGDEDVVFDTAPGSLVAVSDGGFARFTAGPLIAPGEQQESDAGRWVSEYLETGRAQRAFGGARMTDARDLALAMLTAAESRISGHFCVAGPLIQYEEMLAQLELMTGREAKPMGAIRLMPGQTDLFGEAFAMPLRPVRETLSDIVSWYRTQTRRSVMVA